MRTGGRLLAGAMVALFAIVPGNADAAGPAVPDGPVTCTAPSNTPQRLDFSIDGTPTWAMVARPASTPKAVITFSHGYGDRPDDAWDTRDLKLIVEKTGAIVVAPVYRGTQLLGPELTAGAPIVRGAEDTIALARLFKATCGGSVPTVALGLSMGGTIAGLAATEGGNGLYDLWVGLNPMQDAVTASIAANLTGSTFGRDLDADAGGTPFAAPAAYTRRSLVQRHAELAHSGIRGAVIIDALGDATAAQLQTNLLQPLLIADGLKLERHVAVLRDQDTPNDEGGLDPFGLTPGHLGLTSVRVAVDRIAAFLKNGGVQPGLSLRITPVAVANLHTPARKKAKKSVKRRANRHAVRRTTKR